MSGRFRTSRRSALARILSESAADAGCPARIVDEDERPFASATFTGTLHRLVLASAPGATGPGPALDAWLAALPEAELAVPGLVVIDLAVEAPATIVALTVEEA